MPVTTVLAALAMGATLLHLSGDLPEWMYLSRRAFSGEVWRLITCIFPHGDPLHLIMNLYWTWIFGWWMERTLGWPRYLALVVGFAAFSSAAGLLLEGPSIGLSGVGYGSFGFLWALSRNSRRYRDAMDEDTAKGFLLWGVFCVVVTVTGLLNIGNVAHASGLAAGYAIGVVMGASGERRHHALGFLGLCLVLIALGIVRSPAEAGRRDSNPCALMQQLLEQGEGGLALDAFVFAHRAGSNLDACWADGVRMLELTGRADEAAALRAARAP